MFRLLSVHPGADLDVGAAAAQAGVTVAQARRLERLVADHLVQTRSPGRYGMHDLVRAYSAELCGDDETAALRLTEWYVHTLENAADTHPVTQPLRAVEISTSVVPQGFSNRFDALAWCRNEWDNLGAVMYAAVARGWGRLVQAIPAHLRTQTIIQRTRVASSPRCMSTSSGLRTRCVALRWRCRSYGKLASGLPKHPV